jgi:hypothetical protein
MGWVGWFPARAATLYAHHAGNGPEFAITGGNLWRQLTPFLPVAVRATLGAVKRPSRFPM